MAADKISVETLITDWDWSVSTRPTLLLSDAEASLYVGSLDRSPDTTVEASDINGLLSLLEGYRDIFATACDVLRKRIAEDH